MSINLHGAFPSKFSKKKRWQVHAKLVDVITSTIPKSARIIDFGAGLGKYVELLRDCGYDCRGLDGIPEVESLSSGLVQWADLSEPTGGHTCDWAISIETGEHVPPERESTFIRNIVQSARQGAIISWAVPGQRGRGHVNCRMPEYIASEVVRLSEGVFRLDETSTIAAREIVGKGWSKKLLVFLATEASGC